MFHRLAGFCRRLFSSKGFQRGFRIFVGVFAAYYIYNIVLYFIAMKNAGVPFGAALRFYFSIPLFYDARIPPSASVALGIAIGLIWYFHRKNRNKEKAEPETLAEESSDTVREEEIVETTHYNDRYYS